jgi:hypothetical protein
VHFWNLWKVKPCQPWRCWPNVLKTDTYDLPTDEVSGKVSYYAAGMVDPCHRRNRFRRHEQKLE